MTESDKKQSRLRWVTLGEAVAVAALILSALGLWNSWRNDQKKPAPERIIEERRPVPLALRGQADEEGRMLVISAVEPGHALDSLTVSISGSDKAISLGSDGRLRSRDVEQALGATAKRGDDVQRAKIRIDARYVEAGEDRRGGGNYMLTYRWKDGGILGDRSVRLERLSRT